MNETKEIQGCYTLLHSDMQYKSATQQQPNRITKAGTIKRKKIVYKEWLNQIVSDKSKSPV